MTTDAPSTDRAILGDLLYGAPAIADYLGITERQVRHRCDKGQMPHFKIGKTVCGRKTTLGRWLDEREGVSPHLIDSPAAA